MEPITDSTAVEILKNLDKGNTVIFMIAGVRTKNGDSPSFSGIRINMKAGFLAYNENRVNEAVPLSKLFEQILQYVMDSVQPNFKEVIESLIYKAICYDHSVTDEEFKQIKSEMYGTYRKSLQ